MHIRAGKVPTSQRMRSLDMTFPCLPVKKLDKKDATVEQRSLIRLRIHSLIRDFDVRIFLYTLRSLFE